MATLLILVTRVLMAEFHQTIELSNMRSAEVTIKQIDPLADRLWDNLVGIHPDQNVFHHSAWARVLIETYGHQPFYLKVAVGGVDAALVPLMEVRSRLTGCRGVSLPFSDFAGPLWYDTQHAPSVFNALLELSAARKWKHLELRGSLIPPFAAKPFQTYNNHHLDLRLGINTIYQNLDTAVRRAIRKSESSQIEIAVEHSSAAMSDFYLLHGRTRRRHGLPPQPHQFFNAIFKYLVDCDFGSIVLARLAGVPVAGAIFFHSAKRAIYKFGASDTQYWPSRPNQGVMWTAIRELVRIGCEDLQFGRTSPSDEGLARFKLSWGSISQPVSYFRHKRHVDSWMASDRLPLESHPMIFGHLPIACNRLAGRLIYPHLD